MPRRFIFAIVTTAMAISVAALVPVSTAQMRSGGVGRAVHAGAGFGRGTNQSKRTEPFARRGYFLGDTAYFLDDYPFQSPSQPVTTPQIVVMQPPSIDRAPREIKLEPLLIELQGDRYVRYGGAQKSGRGATAAPDYVEQASRKDSVSSSVKPIAPSKLSPATIVYSDGRHEEVRDYAIIGGVMYARGDYWQNGYWTKNIQLSALNIPATIKANRDNGVKFTLPTSPNEVVTRP